MYNSSEGKDVIAEKKKALSHYRSSKQILATALESCAEEEKAEVQDLLDELTETIAALEPETKVWNRLSIQWLGNTCQEHPLPKNLPIDSGNPFSNPAAASFSKIFVSPVVDDVP